MGTTKRYAKRLHMLLATDERRMLDELAAHEGLTPSAAARLAIRRQHAVVFGERPTTASPKPSPKVKR